MSHLRAPAARADRREGGRHGRPVARTAPAQAETHIRSQLLRLAVLPPTAVALSACAAVLFTVRSTGARPGPTLWAVLAGAVAVTGVGIVVAAVAADRAARSVSDRLAALRRGSARGEADLRTLLEALRRGEVPQQRRSRGAPPGDADDFELLAADLARAHEGAAAVVVQAAQLSSQAGSEQKLEVFVNLARRLQSLVHREISILDELENEIEDPDLLKGLFHVDHLATRIRRHAENLAVLGGAVSRRQWSNPVSMTEVLRSAIAEVEQYSRVKLVPPIDGDLRGHAVADVIHLLAELVENATVFSAPHTQVLLRANLVTSGLAVEVEDRGLGMPVEEQSRMNALLADPDQVNVGRLLADGRIGLFVVSQLARRHGIRVRLQSNIYGGVQAVLVVPQALLGSARALPEAVPQNQAALGTALPPLPAPAPPTAPPPAPQNPTGAQRSPRPPRPRTEPTRPRRQPMTTTDVGRTPGPTPAPAPTSAPTSASVPAPTSASVPAPAATFVQRTAGAGRPPLPPQAQQAQTTTGRFPAQDTPAAGIPQAPSHTRNAPEADSSARSPQLQAAREPGRYDARQRPDAPGADERGPAPLPVRGAREERPNPAEAVPGIRQADRPLVEEHAGRAPLPRAGAVRGTMGKPQLPRRRAQEHIAPQLRGGPAPRQDGEETAGHDPGLMAAFQRGIGLAEAQQSLEADVLNETSYPTPDHSGLPDSSGPAEPALGSAPDPLSDPLSDPLPASLDQTSYREPGVPGTTARALPDLHDSGAYPVFASPDRSAHPYPAPEPLPLLPHPAPAADEPPHGDAPAGASEAAPISEAWPAHASAPAHAFGPDPLTARDDGSASAG